jgi:hypothetical protein
MAGVHESPPAGLEPASPTLEADSGCPDRLTSYRWRGGLEVDGYAGFLRTRPSTWIPIPINRGLETCMESVRAVPMRESEEITGWFSAALFGLCLTTPVHIVVLVLPAGLHEETHNQGCTKRFGGAEHGCSGVNCLDIGASPRWIREVVGVGETAERWRVASRGPAWQSLGIQIRRTVRIGRCGTDALPVPHGCNATVPIGWDMLNQVPTR